MKISQELVNIMQEVVDDEQFDWRDDYSGRGMYGRETYGLTGYIQDWTQFVAYVSAAINEEADYTLWNEWEKLIGSVETDSMGRHLIYYFK